MSDLNLVVIKLKSGETCFAEFLGVTENQQIVLRDIIEVVFDGIKTVAMPFFPFSTQEKLPIAESEILFLETLEKEYYSFYCGVVMAYTMSTFDIKMRLNDNPNELELLRDSARAKLQLRFKDWVFDDPDGSPDEDDFDLEDFDVEKSERVLH